MIPAGRTPHHFSDGLSGALINALSKVRGLKVTVRTYAFCFRGKDLDIGEISRKLKVERVLEGSVRKAGCPDIFAIQGEIPAALTAHLMVSLAHPRFPELFKKLNLA